MHVNAANPTKAWPTLGDGVVGRGMLTRMSPAERSPSEGRGFVLVRATPAAAVRFGHGLGRGRSPVPADAVEFRSLDPGRCAERQRDLPESKRAAFPEWRHARVQDGGRYDKW